jgi:dTDP-4-amino-4,6-dideoxygalactose transaminase
MEASAADGLPVSALALSHTLGFMPEMELIEALGIPFIEDCSASYGCSSGGRQAGSFGAFTVLGLEERDMLTSGGGALLYAYGKQTGAALRKGGALPSEYSLADMNAAMATVQFKETEKSLTKRARIAELYAQAAMRQGRHKLFVSPDTFGYNNYAFALALETGMKDVAAYAKRKEIAVESAFDGTPAAAGLAASDRCPCAYSLSLRTAIFPIYPRLSDEAAERVARLIQTLP